MHWTEPATADVSHAAFDKKLWTIAYSLEDGENLPVLLAAEIWESLEAALAVFRAVEELATTED